MVVIFPPYSIFHHIPPYFTIFHHIPYGMYPYSTIFFMSQDEMHQLIRLIRWIPGRATQSGHRHSTLGSRSSGAHQPRHSDDRTHRGLHQDFAKGGAICDEFL